MNAYRALAAAVLQQAIMDSRSRRDYDMANAARHRASAIRFLYSHESDWWAGVAGINAAAMRERLQQPRRRRRARGTSN